MPVSSGLHAFDRFLCLPVYLRVLYIKDKGQTHCFCFISLDIAHAVAMTFQSIELSSLESYLHLKGQALSNYIKSLGWTESSKGVVSIPVNKDNEAKTTVLTENIKFERKCCNGFPLLDQEHSTIDIQPLTEPLSYAMLFLELTKIIGHSSN